MHSKRSPPGVARALRSCPQRPWPGSKRSCRALSTPTWWKSSGSSSKKAASRFGCRLLARRRVSRRRRRLVLRHLGSVSERPPAGGPAALLAQVAAQRQPVERLHLYVFAMEACFQPEMEVVEALDVLPVVLERGLEEGAPASPYVLEVGVGQQ